MSKRYRIGTRARRPDTLREAIQSIVLSPVRLLQGGGPRPDNSGADIIWALKDVSFDVEDGEAVAIIGRNGSGKSTLLKILSRVAEPTEGRAEVRGRVGSLLEIGTGFHPELTGRENVYLSGAILGMRKAEIDRKFDSIIDFSEVEKFIGTPVKRYSSGMQVRLAFAVAAHLEPDILVIDEVLAVGDAAFHAKCLAKMAELQSGGRTILFVSHSMPMVLQICGRAIWLDEGHIALSGDPRTVVNEYLRRGGQVPLGEFRPEQPLGRDGARLISAYVTMEADENPSRGAVLYDQPFKVAAEYVVDAPIDGLRVGVRLHNERDIAVLQTATSDCADMNGDVGGSGHHRAVVEIPGAWLAPGRYYAEVGIWSPQYQHHLRVASAFSFDILDPGISGLGSEILRPRLRWELDAPLFRADATPHARGT